MIVQQTNLKGCYVIEPKMILDQRGYFFESYNQIEFKKKTERSFNVVQTNQSKSNKGVLRGFHFQEGDKAQAKLVRVLSGKVQDVCVDLRPKSKTFGQSFSIILDATENKQLFIPRGFAHGFLVLENNTVFSYMCDNFYNRRAESGIAYNDPELNINWLLDDKNLILSNKDKQLQTLSDFKSKL